MGYALDSRKFYKASITHNLTQINKNRPKTPYLIKFQLLTI